MIDIIIEKLTGSFDEIGNDLTAWVEYLQLSAGANGLSGSEYWEAQAQQSENTIVFTIRWSAKTKVLEAKNATQTYRILFNGVIYNIAHVDNPLFSNQTLKIKAVSV